MPSLFSRLQGNGGLWLAVAAAGMLALCFCNMGFFLDDYAHLAAVRGANPIAGPYDVFCFARGDAESTRLLVDNGPYPWFTSPDIKVHFFRFLSSALMVLDHAVFGRWAPGYHLHCALWYAFMAGMVALLFRRSLGGGLAVLALFLFAVDESHAFPVGWWSNRNAVVAGALCLAGVAAHLRWREDGWKPGLPLSLPRFFLGLLAGESGLSARRANPPGAPCASPRPPCWSLPIWPSTNGRASVSSACGSTLIPPVTPCRTCSARPVAFLSWPATSL